VAAEASWALPPCAARENVILDEVGDVAEDMAHPILPGCLLEYVTCAGTVALISPRAVQWLLPALSMSRHVLVQLGAERRQAPCLPGGRG